MKNLFDMNERQKSESVLLDIDMWSLSDFAFKLYDDNFSYYQPVFHIDEFDDWTLNKLEIDPIKDSPVFSTFEYGMFPQDIIGKPLMDKIKALYDEEKLVKTGNTYCVGEFEEYIYEDKRFILLERDSSELVAFEVKPIVWCYDKTSKVVVANKKLFIFSASFLKQDYKEWFKASFPREILQVPIKETKSYMVKDIITKAKFLINLEVLDTYIKARLIYIINGYHYDLDHIKLQNMTKDELRKLSLQMNYLLHDVVVKMLNDGEKTKRK